MRKLKQELQNRIIEEEKLVAYGFENNNNKFKYEISILNKSFKIIVNYFNNEMTSELIDAVTNEEYPLIDVSTASGKFLGEVREVYDNELRNIINKCSKIEVFKSEYAKLVIEYLNDKYETELEFLWTKLKSNNAIARHKDNKKWYMALLTISEKKLNMNSDKVVEIINLKNTPDEIIKLVDDEKYFNGYHMNKKHWITIKLDGSVPIEKIIEFIDISHNLK